VGAGRGLHLDHVRHWRGQVLAEGPGGLQAVAQLLLGGEGHALRVVDGPHRAVAQAGGGELAAVEGRVRLQVGTWPTVGRRAALATQRRERRTLRRSTCGRPGGCPLRRAFRATW